MEKHQVPNYVAVKSYGQTPSENCNLYTKNVEQGLAVCL